ncbi:hypothetical protein B0H11DRAFT_1958457 [Mycena galericulata]|nr:hypothetical protein B0H11DRAFT_1958457 [Mycena galericulata]
MSAPEWDLEAFCDPVGLPFHTSDSTAVRKYHAQLEAARHLAELTPLAAGQSYSFALTIPQSNLSPGARSIPDVPHSPTVSLRLNQPLQVGAEMMSQVWTAVVEETGTTLVLKIIQPSMCDYPEADRPWTEYMLPQDLATSEAWAYEHIAHKQGCLAPYFFGLHTMITPSGEAAWVLVLEYIPGLTLAEHMDSPTKSFAETCELIKLSMDAEADFSSDGWQHLDIELRNIVVTGSPGARKVVFIDHCFTYRRASSKLHLSPNRRRLYRRLMQSLNYDPDIRQWAEANISLAPSTLPTNL